MIRRVFRSTYREQGIFLVLALFWFSSCQNDPDEIEALVGPAAFQEDRAREVTFLFSENGNTQARLYADEFVRQEKAQPPYVDLRGSLRMEVFDDSLGVESVLTAGYARYYEKQGNILIRDEVVVKNKKGEHLFTDELIYHRIRARFYTEKAVRIETPDQIMYGDGLEANEDFSWYEILHPQGVVKVEKESLPE